MRNIFFPPTRCRECELLEGICKTKYFTWLWKQWVPTPPAVVMMQWKPIQRFLKQNRPYSESLALALFRCYVEHINLCFWNQVVLHWNIPGLHLHYINSIGLTCYDITLEFLKRCLYLPGHISAQNDSNKNLIMLGYSVWKQTLPLFPLIKPTQRSFIFAYSAAGTLILIIS